MISMRKASTFEETVRVVNFGHREARTTLHTVAVVNAARLRSDGVQMFLLVLKMKSCEAFGHIIADDRKALHA